MNGFANYRSDWAKTLSRHLFTWGFPTVSLIWGMLISSPSRTLVWVFALLWLGVVCFAKAIRSGLARPLYLGSFYLIMAVIVVLHGSDLVWLGRDGWMALGIAVLIGTSMLSALTGRVLGKRFW